MTSSADTDPTAAIEVLARLLCAADVHVYGGVTPTWRELSTSGRRAAQVKYRKAAAWLLPRLTVTATPAAQASTVDRATLLREAADAAAEKHRLNPWMTAADVIADVRRMADHLGPSSTPGDDLILQDSQPFIPPVHYRRDDGVDCCVHVIPVGPDSCPACRELAD
jgi:hypothetical protein